MKFKLVKYSFCIVFLLIPAFSSAQSVNEAELRSAYIFNFAEYVDWPGNKTDSIFTVGIYGRESVNGEILSKMADIKAQRSDYMEYLVLHFTDYKNIKDVNILYIPEISRSEQQKLLDKLKNKDILTVGNNLPFFCKDGGIINFLPPERQKSFKINLKAAKETNLDISPKLLILGHIYNKKSQPDKVEKSVH